MAKPPALHIIRRQAARILKVVLKGNAKNRARASLKSLVFKPSIISKKATFALICNTLKCLPVIKQVLESVNLPLSKNKGQVELFYVLTHDLLTEKDLLPSGDAEVLLLSRKTALRAALVRLLVKNNVTRIEDLLPADTQHELACSFPRYARVNTLKMSTEEALEKLKDLDAKIDEHLGDLLVFPPGSDLHDHPLVQQGAIFLQGKASCFPAHILCPEEEWEVLDACSAPGNKTVHLAALMNGKGKVFACELNKSRLKILEETVKRAGANSVEIIHRDFLKIDPTSSKVRAILLDPSCSGSGTSVQRLDHLLPSTSEDNSEVEDKRIQKLAAFQKAALLHALSFPSVERVTYSTCSIKQAENEDVVQSVLEFARSKGFQLAKALPSWPHRGLPVFDEADKVLRTDPTRDKMDGFFVALFEKADDKKIELKDDVQEHGKAGNKKRKKKHNDGGNVKRHHK